MSGLRLFSKSTQSKNEESPFENADPLLSLRVSAVDSNGVEKIDVKDAIESYAFSSDYLLWKQETDVLSVNNFDNKYFNAIVARGEESVPYIYEQLKKGSTHLVHALELIYPDKCDYNKDIISLNRARKKWLRILERQKKH